MDKWDLHGNVEAVECKRCSVLKHVANKEQAEEWIKKHKCPSRPLNKEEIKFLEKGVKK